MEEGVRGDPGIGDVDLHLFNEGTHVRLYEKFGAQLGRDGVRFAVWAPNAERVSVIGDFNQWNDQATPMAAIGSSGVWTAFVPGLGQGEVYKYCIVGRGDGHRVDKADPFGFRHETPPRTASMVWSLEYAWGDAEWMASRHERQRLDSPISIYECHIGSWARVPEDGNRSLGYRELAPRLADHVCNSGFTHVEFLPVMEHPFYGSWGYQVTGYFAPSNRWGSPQDFMYLVDYLHQRGIGVILDWVPAHFPTDEHGLIYFDGTHLFEHADERQGFHPDWKSAIFNYGRNEVKSFLLASARFWLDRYHVDGLRVDGVASMLYLDYSRGPGEWIPNALGGRENLEAIALLRDLNAMAYRDFPDVQTYAEESTAWPMVSRPIYVGGLGFGFKWDMGWMHDTLRYMALDPVHRKFHHGQLTFRGLYAYHENFVLPLSHDEVVHGKGSLLGKMPGDAWQKRAGLRLLLAYMFAQSGKKLLFMGAEIGQWQEWSHDRSLDWHLLEDPAHRGILELVGHLNRLYRGERALHQLDNNPLGMAWIDANDVDRSLLAFERRSEHCRERIVCAFNFTPVPRTNCRLGVDCEGYWREVLNTDAVEYGGSGQGNLGGVEATIVPSHDRPLSIVVTVPPLGAAFFRSP